MGEHALPFSVSVQDGGDRAFIVCAGDFDAGCETQWASAMIDAYAMGYPSIQVDMEHVRFIDSSGLRYLLLSHGQAADFGVALTILPGSSLRRMGEITGVAVHLWPDE